jgi:hypothetical protein
MRKVINAVAMTVDGLVDVGAWFVAEAKHGVDSLAQFDDAGMLVGRTTYEGLSGFLAPPDGGLGGQDELEAEVRASRALQEPLDCNATLNEGDAVDGVVRLKKREAAWLS